MEAGKTWSVATLAVVLVLSISSVSVTWHCVNEVARLQSRVERLEADDKSSSISQLFSQLETQMFFYQEDSAGANIPGHQREVRQTDAFSALIIAIVRAELESLLNCSTDEKTRCTIEPGPQGDPGPSGPPGPQGQKGDEGVKGDQGEQGEQGYTGFKGEKGEAGQKGLQGSRAERGEKGDMGTQGLMGEKGKGGPRGLMGAKGEKGHAGFKGQKGDVGKQGMQGFIVKRGKKGEKGPGGEKGEKGVAGPKGLMGTKGDKGQLGYPGFQGSPGERGEKGEKGDTGAQGLPGEPSLNGEMEDSNNLLEPHTCGGTSGWTRVAYLNMCNSSHQCPGDMVEVNVSGKRLCGRPADVPSNSCVSANFSTNRLQYSRVCGRITGYQYGDAYGFQYSSTQLTLDSYYVDGVIVTHGPPGNRVHVWTFANGVSERSTPYARSECPCASNEGSGGIIPSFVGHNFFCESGYIIGLPPAHTLLSHDPLWDRDGCSIPGNTCCESNNPPYFTRQLITKTDNDLEVQACGQYSRNDGDDTLIELIELYIKR